MNAYVRGVAAISCALALILLSEARAEEPRSHLSTAFSQTVISGSISTSVVLSPDSGPATARIHIGPWGVQVGLSQFNPVPSAIHLNGPILDRSIYYVPVTDGLMTSLGGLMRMNPQSARAAIESMFPMPNERIYVGSLGGVGRVNSQFFGGGAGTGLALGYHVRNGTGAQGTFTQMLNRPGGILRGYDLLTQPREPSFPVGVGLSNSTSHGSLTLGSVRSMLSGANNISTLGIVQMAVIRTNISIGLTITNSVPLPPAPIVISTGTVTTGTLNLSSSAGLVYEVDGTSTPGDLLVVNGNLTLDGTLNLAGYFNSGTYRLINYTGTLAENSLSIGTLTGTVSTPTSLVIDATPGQVNLIVAGPVAVPEPATLGLGLLAAVGALAGWRRRRR